MALSKLEIRQLVAKLRHEPGESSVGLSTAQMVLERQEAAMMIEELSSALHRAEAVCDKAMAALTRWQSGKRFDVAGLEAAIQFELYDLVRPGAREGIEKLHALMSSTRQDRGAEPEDLLAQGSGESGR